MGQAARTTKLLLDFSKKKAGGANAGKRAYLEETVALLNKARTSYVDFFLAYPDCFRQKVLVQNQEAGEWSEQPISSNRLLTWTEAHTVATADHPTPDLGWNFSEQFPEMPYQYRRSVIKDSLGRVKAYLTATEKWQATGAKKGKPGLPAPRNHLTLYQGLFPLELNTLDLRETFARFKVYTGKQWRFSIRSGKPMQERGGKLFRCLACGYQAHADFNASANVQRSFWREYHWQPRPKKGKKPPPALSRYR